MRILLCGVATVALSGCSWMGSGNSHKGQTYRHSPYLQKVSNYGCCVDDKKWIRRNVEASRGGSDALNPNRKRTLTGRYAQAKGNEVNWGTKGTATLRGTMSDYKKHGTEAGVRQYNMPVRTYRHNPYLQVGDKTWSRWNVEAGLGTDFVVKSDAITGSQANPMLLNPTTVLKDVSMKDAYAIGYRAELGGSYALNPNTKLTLTGHYAQAKGNEVNWGTQGAATLRGTMSDYKSYGIEAGVRQYIMPVRVSSLKSVRPYVEGKIGAAHLDAVRLENINAVGGLVNPGTPTSLAMYESGWVPTAAGLVGIETPIFKRFTMGVEAGIRYSRMPNSDNLDKQDGTFNARYVGVNNSKKRWSIPLTIRGRYRF